MKNSNVIRPLFDRVLLRPVEDVNSSGIFVPRDATERSLVMEVVATGDADMQVNLGDHVVVAKYAGTELVFPAEKFLLVRHCEILAVLEKEAQ